MNIGIAVQVYDRPDYLEQCILALKTANLPYGYDVHFFQDAPTPHHVNQPGWDKCHDLTHELNTANFPDKKAFKVFVHHHMGRDRGPDGLAYHIWKNLRSEYEFTLRLDEDMILTESSLMFLTGSLKLLICNPFYKTMVSLALGGSQSLWFNKTRARELNIGVDNWPQLAVCRFNENTWNYYKNETCPVHESEQGNFVSKYAVPNNRIMLYPSITRCYHIGRRSSIDNDLGVRYFMTHSEQDKVTQFDRSTVNKLKYKIKWE